MDIERFLIKSQIVNLIHIFCHKSDNLKFHRFQQSLIDEVHIILIDQKVVYCVHKAKLAASDGPSKNKESQLSVKIPLIEYQ